MKINVLFLAIVLTLLTTCKENESVNEPVVIKTPVWQENSLTQPVPVWGSKTRLSLPVAVNDLLLPPYGSIGAFGTHQGGHPEGLGHVWLMVKLGIPIRSWADGKVTKIENTGSEYFITIEYADGLYGKHMEVKTPLVKVGDLVSEGNPVAYGLSYGGYQSAEFMLNDKNRNDGVVDYNKVAYVSPFDYLKAEVKAALELRFNNEVTEFYFKKGLSSGSCNIKEPYLTNQVIFHKKYKGTIAGEWILKSKWQAGGHPDILVLLDVKNMFYSGKRLIAADDVSEGKLVFEGTWDADTTLHRFVFTNYNKTVYYGIYELNDKSDRATLKIEYRTISYPTSFSSEAALYIERAPLPRRMDAESLGVY